MDKICFIVVFYFNMKLLLYGLFNSMLAFQLDLELNIFFVCVEKLIRGEVDLVFVLVVVLFEFDNLYVILDYCIGIVGVVKMVCIYSDVFI